MPFSVTGPMPGYLGTAGTECDRGFSELDDVLTGRVKYLEEGDSYTSFALDGGP